MTIRSVSCLHWRLQFGVVEQSVNLYSKRNNEYLTGFVFSLKFELYVCLSFLIYRQIIASFDSNSLEHRRTCSPPLLTWKSPPACCLTPLASVLRNSSINTRIRCVFHYINHIVQLLLDAPPGFPKQDYKNIEAGVLGFAFWIPGYIWVPDVPKMMKLLK